MTRTRILKKYHSCTWQSCCWARLRMWRN
jgi:hypothetical protein